MNPLKLSFSDESLTTQNPNASARWGNLRGGGQTFSFGGINDSPAGRKWVWMGLAAAALLAGAFFYFNRRKS